MDNTMLQGLLVTDDDKLIDWQVEEPSLSALRRAISTPRVSDPWLELIHHSFGIAYIDEEGKFDGQRPNLPATRLLKLAGWAPNAGDVLYGPALILGHVTRDGRESSLTEHGLASLKTVWEEIHA